MKVSILGRMYEVREGTPSTDVRLKSADGYCDSSIGVCVIDKMEPEEDSLKDLTVFKQKVMRHELIHAFLEESGLREQCEWATEEMVDWVAMQFPKMLAAFQDAGCI